MDKLINYMIGTLFVLSFVFLQAFALYRLPLLIVVFFFCLFYCIYRKVSFGCFSVFVYYILLSTLTVLWCFIGLYYENSSQAIYESFFVYAIYPLIYLPIVLYLSKQDYKAGADVVFFISSMGIFLFAVYTVLNGIFSLNILPQSFNEQMLLEVGIHEGYTQLNNVNIGALCFILPYAVCRCLIEKKISAINVLTIILSLSSAVIASRRIVMFIFVISPLISLLIYLLSSKSLNTNVARKFFKFYCYLIMSLIFFGSYFYIKDNNAFYSFYDRVSEVFVKDPYGLRTIQNESLLNSLDETPFLGAGFGGLTEIIRSEERPWTFESTYHRVAFNSGFIGISILFVFFLFYSFLAICKMRSQREPFVNIALLVGFVSILIASATNPYMSSFDYVFVFSIFPLVINSINFRLKGSTKIE